MPAKNNVIKQLSKVFLVLDTTGTAGSTTLTADAAVAATALTVAAITNFAAGDLIRIGAGEEMELGVITGAPSGNTINLVSPGLVYAHLTGEAVVEQTAFDLGDVEAGGVSLSFTGESTDVQVATKRLAFTTLRGFLDASVEFSLPTFTLPNIAIAAGILQSVVRGAGTAADPTELTTDGNEFAGVSNASIVAVGTKYDGTYIRAELWGVDFDYTGVNFSLTRGQLAAVPVRAVAAAGGAFFSTNYGFTPSTALVVTKGKVWDSLTEVGFFLDTATTTTVNGALSAGATSLVMTSGTSFADGDWVRIGSGDTAQFLWLGTKSTNTFTLRTRNFRAIGNGLTITKVTPTKFAGISPDGATLSLGGSVEPLRVAERPMSIGIRAGAATVSLAYATVDVSLANIARALGIPSAQVANNRLPVGSLIGAATLEGVYAKGLLQDGNTAWVISAGNAMDVSQVQTVINNSGPAATVPMVVKPSSYVQFLQHA